MNAIGDRGVSHVAPAGFPRWLRSRAATLAMVGAISLGALVRASVVSWSDPWAPHHPDEHILPLEALALWEGITPREIGWPASTSRLILSAAEGLEMIADRGAAVWRTRHSPDAALHLVAEWIGAQYRDPTRLYRTGRAVSVIVGIGQLIALAWALRRWTGHAGAAIATLGVGLAVTPVLYSQYVLADIFGVFFATIIVGLAAVPSNGAIVAMGAVAGFAASSKFHFGIWLLTPIIVAALGGQRPRRRLIVGAGAIAAAGCVIVGLVPWLWLNPPLAAKEVIGVIGPKVAAQGGIGRLPLHLTLVVTSVGVPLLVGAVVGMAVSSLGDWKRLAAIAVPSFAAAAAVIASGITFDRYALVLVPGVAVLAAVGWDRWLTSRVPNVKRLGVVAASVCVAVSALTLWRAELVARETDVDVLVKRWILDHVPDGRRVAVHDETNAMLPRTPTQLRQCAAFVNAPAAYRLKWSIEGVEVEGDDEPMRAMLLNDETFAAYWCRRELDAPSTKSFYVVPYHDDRRFGAVLEADVVREFARGERTVTGGIDVLVMNREVDVNTAPVAAFTSARGRRVIYER